MIRWKRKLRLTQSCVVDSTDGALVGNWLRRSDILRRPTAAGTVWSYILIACLFI